MTALTAKTTSGVTSVPLMSKDIWIPIQSASPLASIPIPRASPPPNSMTMFQSTALIISSHLSIGGLFLPVLTVAIAIMIIKAGTASVTFVENALTKLDNASWPKIGPEDLSSEGTIHKNIAAIKIARTAFSSRCIFPIRFRLALNWFLVAGKVLISGFIIKNMTTHETRSPIMAWGVPTTNQSTNDTVSPGTNSSTVAFEIRLGAVLISKSIAPELAAWPSERKLASA